FKIAFRVARFYRDSFRRQPGFGAARWLRAADCFKGDIRKVRYAAHGCHHITSTAWGSPPLIMVRMLVADDPAELFRTIILQRGLARQIGDCDHPAESGFGAVLRRRNHPVGPIEGS